jgi:hypothetical protein
VRGFVERIDLDGEKQEDTLYLRDVVHACFLALDGLTRSSAT